MGIKLVKIGFEMEGRLLRLDQILPVKQIPGAVRTGRVYATIKASIKEIGVIEPPLVYPSGEGRGASKKYFMVDGHVRVEILKELGHTEVFCLVSNDFDIFNPNHKVNRISGMQEHFMIMRAVESGVSEERIAKTLNVDVARIREMRNILKGLCPEAIELLRGKPITAAALRSLRKVKPLRQIAIAELLNAASKHTVPYVRALIAATPEELREESFYARSTVGISAEDMARMQTETENLEHEIKLVKKTHGPNMFNLVLAAGYIAKLLKNNRVVRFLSKRNSDILAEFEKIVQASSLENQG